MDKSTQEKLARYRQLRATGRNLHRILLDWLPKNALKECGKRLGIYSKGVLVFNSEHETSVLMDYCIYDYRWGGQNVIERYAAQAPIESDSDERILLDAMLQARYSLFAIDEMVRGVGVQAHDLLSQQGASPEAREQLQEAMKENPLVAVPQVLMLECL